MTKTLRAAVMAALALALMPLQARADNLLASAVERDYGPRADSLTTVLVRKFLNVSKGTFWAVPSNQSNRESATTYIYWQQAHAMDVVIYAYERVKDSDAAKAATYQRYMELWYKNHANNWYHADNDPTGFLNEYTDDMCWIALTLLHMSEALGEDKYAETARTLFDDYIEPRGWADSDGYWGLPWKSNDMGRNACTNSPGCLVACKLYEKYGDERHLQTAIDIYNYQANEMKTKLDNDGRVEEPPLTYTQGTFSEACRHLYHATGDRNYLTMATKVTQFLCSSNRCTDRGLLRHEGTSMDQSIFKAVAVPYIANMILDEEVTLSYRRTFLRFLQRNANALWENLDLSKYPSTYCNYYWGEPVNPDEVPSMGAMVSGCSLMESVARVARQLLADETAIGDVTGKDTAPSGRVFTVDGRASSSLKKGLYIADGRKVIVK